MPSMLSTDMGMLVLSSAIFQKKKKKKKKKNSIALYYLGRITLTGDTPDRKYFTRGAQVPAWLSQEMRTWTHTFFLFFLSFFLIDAYIIIVSQYFVSHGRRNSSVVSYCYFEQ